jgi:hypothetical protein
MSKCRRRSRLVKEAVERFQFVDLLANDLDGDRPIEVDVPPEVDGAHPAGPDLADKFEVGYSGGKNFH